MEGCCNEKNIEFSDGDAVGHGPWNGVSDDSLSGRAAETAETAGETVSAAETVLTANQDGEAAADSSMSASGIYDAADLLSADEEASLLTKLEKYSERYSADIAIVTTDDAGG